MTYGPQFPGGPNPMSIGGQGAIAQAYPQPPPGGPPNIGLLEQLQAQGVAGPNAAPGMMEQLGTQLGDPNSPLFAGLMNAGGAVMDAANRDESTLSALGQGTMAGMGAYQGQGRTLKEQEQHRLTAQREQELEDLQRQVLLAQLQQAGGGGMLGQGPLMQGLNYTTPEQIPLGQG